MSDTVLRVMVVDDNESVRRGICQLLTAHADIDVVCEGADGADAIRKAREHKPDLILMDVTMPTMNGLEATRIIKRELPGTHIIVISQHDAAQFRREAMSAGASEYIMKTEIAARLLAEVRKLQVSR
jgi:DNA-binding NarL/FixJ family response regulator